MTGFNASAFVSARIISPSSLADTIGTALHDAGLFCCAHKAYGKIPQTETVATVLGNNSNRTANLPQASITCR